MENSETKTMKKSHPFAYHFLVITLGIALGVGLNELLNFIFDFNSDKFISVPILIGILACAVAFALYLEKKISNK